MIAYEEESMKKEPLHWLHEQLERLCDSISSTEFSESEKEKMIEWMLEIIAYFETLSEDENGNR